MITVIPMPLYEAVRSKLSGQGKTLTVQFDDDWDINSFNMGNYNPQNTTIRLRMLDDLNFAHEYGHLLQISVLDGSADIKNQWMAMNHGAEYGSGEAGQTFVSGYAATSYAEDFAETFSVLLADPQTAQNMTAQYPDCGAVEKLLYLKRLLSEAFSLDSNIFPDIYPSQPSTWAADGIAEYLELFPYGCLASDTLPFYAGYQNGVTRRDFAQSAYELVKTIWREQYDISPALDPWHTVYPDFNPKELNPFSDLQLSGNFSVADNAVIKLHIMGVLNGKSDSIFDPEGLITRQEAATMLYRLCATLGYSFTESSLPTLNDITQCADWAIDSVNAIYSAKVMTGVGNDMFNPTGAYSYEQSAITMVRVYHLLRGEAI